MAATTLAPQASHPRVSWIVCLNRMRDVDEHGLVRCPLAGIVPLQHCGECRFLEDREADWRRQPCATDEI
jgi:hypothetical protein